MTGAVYRWTPYKCSKYIPVGEWISELNKVGIQEISFIGDSHQQRLAIHVQSLLRRALTGGGRGNGWRIEGQQMRNAWAPMEVYNFSHPGGARLRTNSHFIRGIFHPWDAYGCV